MTFAQISNIIVLQNIFKCAHFVLGDFLMISAQCIIFCSGEDFKMEKNRLNSNLPSVIELNRLLSKIGAESTLAKIRQYVGYRSNYLVPNKKFKLQDNSEATWVFCFRQSFFNLAFVLSGDAFGCSKSVHFAEASLFALLFERAISQRVRKVSVL